MKPVRTMAVMIGMCIASASIAQQQPAEAPTKAPATGPVLPTADDVFSPVQPAMTAEQAMKEIESLFAEDIARVAATTSPQDDIELAKTLLIAARNPDTQASVVGALCDKIGQLIGNTRSGLDIAAAAARIGVQRVPDRKIEFLNQLIVYQQKQLATVVRAKRQQANHALVDSMAALADALIEKDDVDAALSWSSKASALAASSGHPDQAALIAGYSALRHLQTVAKQIKTHEAKLQSDPNDASAHRELFRLCLIELDDPSRAFGYVLTGGTETDQSFVLLAGLALQDVPAGDLLGLGDYYRELSSKASEVAKPAMLRRAASYYETFLASGQAVGLGKNKAQLILQGLYRQLGIKGPVTGLSPAGAIDSPTSTPTASSGPRSISEDVKTWAAKRDQMTPNDQITAVMQKLRDLHNGQEFILRGRGVKGDVVTQLDLSGNKGLANIDPLLGMKLTELNLSACTALTDLKALEGMKLTRLVLKDCTSISSLDPLSDMQLRQLDLRGCTGLKGDLAALANSKLNALMLSGCSNIKSLEGVEGQSIVKVMLDGCTNLKGDLSVLKDMPVTSLTLKGCSSLTSLTGIEDLKLSGRFSLEGCAGLEGDLSALKGMRFIELNLDGCSKLTSLTGLSGMPLNKLQARNCRNLAVDLKEVEKSRRLTFIDVQGAASVTNVASVRRIPLKALNINTRSKPSFAAGTGRAPSLAQLLGNHPTLRAVRTGIPKIDKQIAAAITKRIGIRR